jgi:hypothetical protein
MINVAQSADYVSAMLEGALVRKAIQTDNPEFLQHLEASAGDHIVDFGFAHSPNGAGGQ